MQVVISQPLYAPWLGFFDQISRADVLVWLDDVKFSKGSYVNRNRLLVAGYPRWFTIPLTHSSKRGLIRDLEASRDDWGRHNLEFFERALKDKPEWEQLERIIRPLEDQGSVVDTVIAITEGLADFVGVLPPVRLRSTDLGLGGYGSQRVLNIVCQLGGSSYLSGNGGRNYLEHSEFERRGVEVRYMRYAFLPWPQTSTAFNPEVSALDCFASVGPQALNLHSRCDTVPWDG